MKWLQNGTPRPKIFRVKNSLDKFSPPFFVDPNGMLFIDYNSRVQTINTEYYLSLLVQLTNILRENLHVKSWREILFLPENSPVHRTIPKQKKLVYPVFHSMIVLPIHGTWPFRGTTC